jgi:hypothetical protein
VNAGRVYVDGIRLLAQCSARLKALRLLEVHAARLDRGLNLHVGDPPERGSPVTASTTVIDPDTLASPLKEQARARRRRGRPRVVRASV